MIRNKKTGFGLKAVLASLLVAVIFLGGCTTTQNNKVYHVGVLSGLDFFANTTDGFKAKMAELGYIEGKNIVYDVQKSNFDMAAYRSTLQKFVADKVDLIFVFPTEASMEAKKATEGTGIPVVFTNAFIEDTNLVKSVREPGGNITGVRWAGPDMALQRFEIMRELLPHAKRMWIVYQKGYPIVKSQLEALRPAFATAGIIMTEIPADNTSELEAGLRMQVSTDKPDAILLIPEPLIAAPDAFMVLSTFADEYKIPIGGTLFLINGHETIFGSTPQSIPQGKQAAVMADKILRGIPAGTIPVVSAENYIQINYRAIQKLGLNVSESLLVRADEIIR
jgi:putative ABC transport system substrate-binding protein